MWNSGSGHVTVFVMGLLAAVCMAQFQQPQNHRGFYGQPLLVYGGGGGGSIRQPRSILQNFAVDRMLKDNGFVRSIINCVLDKGPCESNGRKLRLMAPEILRGQCPGCSRTVHNQIRRVISHVQRNFPVEWSEVTRRFMSYNNPTGHFDSYAPPPPQPPQQLPPPQQEQAPPQLPQTYNPDPNMNMYQNYG